ncbi:MAG: STAS/SEC14 domain-containing protein [Bacillus sp. (in: firmicutes)]
MIKILPSLDDSTLAVEISGKAMEEDAQRMITAVEQRFGNDQPFNILAVIDDIDGTTLSGVAKGLKFDFKYLMQMRKIAVVSEKNWIEKMTGLGDYMPGMELKHFPKGHVNEAWTWIKQKEL